MQHLLHVALQVQADIQHQQKNSQRCSGEGRLLVAIHQHFNAELVIDNPTKLQELGNGQQALLTLPLRTAIALEQETKYPEQRMSYYYLTRRQKESYVHQKKQTSWSEDMCTANSWSIKHGQNMKLSSISRKYFVVGGTKYYNTYDLN